MNEVLLKILKTHSGVTLPQYESDGASGMDIRAFTDNDILIKPLARIKIPTGLRLEIPQGYEAQVRPRSGLAIKQGITVLNSPGTIDCDYRGDLDVILINLSDSDVTIKNGDRIAQLVIAPVIRVNITEVKELTQSQRGCGGFGSTGVR